MQNANCDLNWVSKVFADSGLKPAQAKHLQVGQKVLLAGSCKATPPHAVVMRSAAILRMDTGWQSLRKEVNKLRESNDDLSKKYLSAAKKRDEFEQATVVLQGKLDRTKEVPVEKIVVEESSWMLLLSSMILGAVAAGAVFYFVQMRLEKNKVSYIRGWTIRENGKTYDFTFAGVTETSPGSGVYIALYRCPCCHEKRLFGRDKNLRSHITEAHPEERIQEDVHPSLLHQS
ncbi:hypothetical protein H0W91_01730 [Patescibacteria group bacterium]|nr:hypothetical protein [Patescibacteria group bacterium]